MRIHNVTPWDAGNILTSCADYLGAKEEDLREAGNASDALESLFQLDPNNQKRWNFFYTRATAGLRKACKLHEDEAAKGPAPKEEQK